MVKINKRVRRPQPLPDLVPADQFSWTIQQHRQHLKRLIVEPGSHSRLAQFSSAEIRFENPKAHNPGPTHRRRHD
jgi:hypothetical protein